MTRAEVERRARELEEQELAPEEFLRRLEAVRADDAELEQRAALVRWFSTRYPTVEARFAYARRKLRELAESPLVVPDSPPR